MKIAGYQKAPLITKVFKNITEKNVKAEISK